MAQSRFKKASQSIWHCKYHIVWVPKYRYRVLQGQIKSDVENSIRKYSVQQKCEIMELNVQIDHVHLLVMIPPKISISAYVGKVKGRTAIEVLNRFKQLKQYRYWGNHFWAKGYCVDTIGLNEEMIRKYVKYQEKNERKVEQQRGLF